MERPLTADRGRQSMTTTYVVLGAGRQGTAAAKDLLEFDAEAAVRLADRDADLARMAAARVNDLLGRAAATAHALDVRDEGALGKLLGGAKAVLSAVPYMLNLALARAAVEAGASFCDLGGNTEIVNQELALDARARARGVSVVPDCGLAPGMANTLAARLIERLDGEGGRARHVRILCGGLPEQPRGVLGYQLVFAVEGLTNEYAGKAQYLRGGRVVEVDTLEEVEAVDFPPVGPLEAFTTSGGTSTCPYTYEGRLETYEYKTLRYPGHVEKLRLLRDIGFLDLDPVGVSAPGAGDASARADVAPRAMLNEMLRRRLPSGEPDLVLLRVTCSGQDARGRPVEMAYELVDRQDPETGFTAMERTTAYPAAIVCAFLASGDAPRGAIPLERAVPGDLFIRELARRGLPLIEARRSFVAASTPL
jgi:lysine 6-dehydrogenase